MISVSHANNDNHHDYLANLHDEAWVCNVVVVGAVGVHQGHREGELGQGDVLVDVGLGLVHPLHGDLQPPL